MASFGKRSQEKLDTCDIRIQKILNVVVTIVDCSVICGTRTEEEQNAAFHDGRSKLKYPKSKHNSYPSTAVDVVPYFKNKPHIRWDDKEAFYYFAGVVMAVAASQGVKLRWGGNWDRDDEFHDQTFMDLPHFEIVA